MAVTEVRLHSAGAGGKATGRDGSTPRKSFRLRYRAKVDDAVPSPDTVLEHFATTATLPWIGDEFEMGSTTVEDSICTDVEPSYIEGSDGWFDVHVTFEDQSAGGGPELTAPTLGGALSPNPLEWADEIDVQSVPISVLAEFGYFRGWLNADGGGVTGKPHLTVDDFRALVYSNMKPIDPTIEDEWTIKVIRITTYRSSWNSALYNALDNVVNEDAVTINKPSYGFVETFGPYFGLARIGASFAIVNGIPHWRQTAEIMVNPLGWRRNVLDRGLEELLEPGDDDDQGTTLSASDFPPQRQWDHFAIRDGEGQPIISPILLDGKGRRLAPDGLPVYGVWSTKEEASYMAHAAALWNGETI